MSKPCDSSACLQLSGDEASNGLVLPAVAIVYFGKAGAVLVVIICFMAVTSSGAGEILAAASLFTFDVYRNYFRPKVPAACSAAFHDMCDDAHQKQPCLCPVRHCECRSRRGLPRSGRLGLD